MNATYHYALEETFYNKKKQKKKKITLEGLGFLCTCDTGILPEIIPDPIHACNNTVQLDTVRGFPTDTVTHEIL